MKINWLLVFVPIVVALEHAVPQAHTWIFFAACVAIIPIASLIVAATEHIASRTGDAVGGLLNATFGNAPELIIAVVALKAGLFDMVRASLIGAILANLLLAQGVAFFLGGLRYHEQTYNLQGANAFLAVILPLAVLGLVLPNFTVSSPGPTLSGLQATFLVIMSIGLYGVFLAIQNLRHRDYFRMPTAVEPSCCAQKAAVELVIPLVPVQSFKGPKPSLIFAVRVSCTVK